LRNEYMSGCGCGTSGSSNSTSKTKGLAYYELKDGEVFRWDKGSHAAGSVLAMESTGPLELTLAGIEAPNILIFNENPCLSIGSNIILDNLASAKCMIGLVNCLSVTAASVLVGGKYRVTTNGGWAGAALDFSTSSGISLCGTSANTVAAPIARICGANPVVSDYSGFIYLRPLNSPPIAGTMEVSNGASIVKWKSSSDSPRPPMQGDTIELFSTAIVGANAAKVLFVAAAGSTSSIITLDKPVTGVTATASVGQLPCVTFISKPAKIADLTFNLVCGCQVNAILPASVSSSPNFPMGRSVECGACMRQSYCVEINCKTPGNSFTVKGEIIL
jgi:hypothetical protein